MNHDMWRVVDRMSQKLDMLILNVKKDNESEQSPSKDNESEPSPPKPEQHEPNQSEDFRNIPDADLARILRDYSEHHLNFEIARALVEHEKALIFLFHMQDQILDEYEGLTMTQAEELEQQWLRYRTALETDKKRRESNAWREFLHQYLRDNPVRPPERPRWLDQANQAFNPPRP